MKTLHLFYQVRSADGTRLSSADLYAFTTDTEMADEFIRTRSRTVFYHKEEKFQNKSDYLHFVRYSSHQPTAKGFDSKRLVRTVFNTRAEPFSNQVKRLPIVVTAFEEFKIFTESDKIMQLLSQRATFNLQCVKNEYIKSLYNILYFQSYWSASISYDDPSPRYFYFYSGLQTDLGLKSGSFHVDEYKLFMFLFGGLFEN